MSTPTQDPAVTIAIATMKARYFELYAQEDIGKTPEITGKLDNLESAIRTMMA